MFMYSNETVDILQNALYLIFMYSNETDDILQNAW